MKAFVAAWAGRSFKTTTDSGAGSDVNALTEIIHYNLIDSSNGRVLHTFNLAFQVQIDESRSDGGTADPHTHFAGRSHRERFVLCAASSL